MRILMICMGNICRSPTAEAVLRHKLRDAGLHWWIEVDSAGTHAYHVGSAPDDRSQAHAQRRGYDLTGLRARRVADDDFESFDLLLAMDRDNLQTLLEMCPPTLRPRVRLLMDYAPRAGGRREVPDPYYGSAASFEMVLDLVESACDGLVSQLSASPPRQP